jgi:hypothetical protein
MSGSALASHPILFSGPMIRAILEGRKTQTRRIITPQPIYVPEHDEGGYAVAAAVMWDKTAKLQAGMGWNLLDSAFLFDLCPYGGSGWCLWVRETVDAEHLGDGRWRLTYRADGAPVDLSRELPGDARLKYGKSRPFVPSIFMPRWASRLTLEVTAVRVERLHQLSEDDAKAEGHGVP